MGCAGSQTNPTGEESRGNACGKPEIRIPLPSISFPGHRAAGRSHSWDTLHNGDLLPAALQVSLNGTARVPQPTDHRSCSPGSVPVPVTARTCATTTASAQRAHMPALPCGIASQQEEAANASQETGLFACPTLHSRGCPGTHSHSPPLQGRAGSSSKFRAPNSLSGSWQKKRWTCGRDQAKAPQL